MSIESKLLQRIIEGALLASAKPLTVVQLAELFEEQERPAKDQMMAALEDIQNDCKGRGFELMEVASGFRFQVVQDVAVWVARLWEEKPQKYSRALLETLALIAYRQPITRGDIEDIRGVAVSSNIVKTLLEREWVRVVGHKDVPGRPAMYATTRRFLDYFNLKNLEDLPSLSEIRDLDSMNQELALEGADTIDPELLALAGSVNLSVIESESELESASEPQSEISSSDQQQDDTADVDTALRVNADIDESDIATDNITTDDTKLLTDVNMIHSSDESA